MGEDSHHSTAIESFIGRRRELQELVAGLSQVASGHGTLFLVSGEPGIGKTRLADQLAAHAAAEGFFVLWGRCWEGDGAPAYWPWIQILRRCGGGIKEGDIGFPPVSTDGKSALDAQRILSAVERSFISAKRATRRRSGRGSVPAF